MSRRAKTAPKVNRAIRELVDAYLEGGTAPWSDRGLEAESQVEDLAKYDPEAFWQFLLLLLERRPGLSDRVPLGRSLTWLLRYYPDQFDERVAGLARRDRQMRDIISAVDQDRIAPDVWAKLETALLEAEAGRSS